MKKHWLISVAALAFVSTGAFAQDAATAGAIDTAKSHYHAPKTLEEARAMAHARADKLDKMTQAEWDAKKSKRDAWKAKWNAMTPEQQAAYKASHHRKHKDASTASGSAPAAAPTTPTAPIAAPETPASAAPSLPAVASPPSAASPAVTPPAASPTAPAEMTAPPMPTTPSAPPAAAR